MGAFIYRCTFAKNKWDPADWLTVKSPRWPHVGAWVQRDDCLENRVPADASVQELSGRRAGETYSSMLYREPLAAFCARVEMAFAERMAPLVTEDMTEVDPGLVQVRIDAERARMPFRDADEFIRVHGIGPVILESVRPHLRFGPTRRTSPARGR